MRGFFRDVLLYLFAAVLVLTAGAAVVGNVLRLLGYA